MALDVSCRNLLRLQPILYGWMKLFGFNYVRYRSKTRRVAVIPYASAYLVYAMIVTAFGVAFIVTQIATKYGSFDTMVNPSRSKTIFAVEIAVTVIVIVYFFSLRLYCYANRRRCAKLLNLLESLSDHFELNYTRMFLLSNGGIGALVLVHNSIRWPFYLELYKTSSSILLVVYFTLQSITMIVAELEMLAVLYSLYHVTVACKRSCRTSSMAEAHKILSKTYECRMLVNKYYGFPFLLAIAHQLIWTVIYFYKTLIAHNGLSVQNIILTIVDPFWCISTVLMIVLITYFDSIMKQANEAVLCTRYFNDYNITDSKTVKQINKFLLKNLHQKKKFSAYGFFNIDNSVIYMIFSSIVTYLVILVQFKQLESDLGGS